jgi:hypothetical protein
MLQLIELLWTRISYKHKLDPAIFGEDLTLEGANLFITGNIVNVDGMRGWNFDYKNISRKSLQENDGNKDWEPVKLTIAQHHIIAYLCKYGKVRINRINQCLDMIGEVVETERFIQQLLDTSLVYIKNNKDLVLATQRCQAVITKDGFFAADNKTGRLTRWFKKNYPTNNL